MSEEHAFRAVERHCDVAVVGASAAGLAAALELGRQCRSVIVVDAGEPQDGGAGPERDERSREEVRRHGGEILAGRACRVTRAPGGRVRVELVGGHAVVARRVLAAGAIAVGDLPGAEGFTDSGVEVLGTAADGSRVGAMVGQSLASEDAEAAARPSAQATDWDHRYGGERMWSGNPNGSLVNEVTGMSPGRALDVGAGEGGDAIWLAEQGWKVTASDISLRALERVGAEAERRKLPVECHRCDANALEAYEPAAFDLVSAHYASIPRTPEDRAVHNLLNAVAPGGTLLVVSHDLEPMRAPIDTHRHSQAFDPDAYVRVEDFAAVLAKAPNWEVEVHEKRPRPAGAASTHHVDDIILRARRAG